MRNGGRVVLGLDSDSDSRIRREGRQVELKCQKTVKTERV